MIDGSTITLLLFGAMAGALIGWFMARLRTQEQIAAAQAAGRLALRVGLLP
jgi:hypothetical protein